MHSKHGDVKYIPRGNSQVHSTAVCVVTVQSSFTITVFPPTSVSTTPAIACSQQDHAHTENAPKHLYSKPMRRTHARQSPTRTFRGERGRRDGTETTDTPKHKTTTCTLTSVHTRAGSLLPSSTLCLTSSSSLLRMSPRLPP